MVVVSIVFDFVSEVFIQDLFWLQVSIFGGPPVAQVKSHLTCIASAVNQPSEGFQTKSGLCRLTIPQPSLYPPYLGRVKEVLVLAGCDLLAKNNLDAAGDRLQKALEQLQTTVDRLLNKAEQELSGSTRQLTALRGERERVGEALAEMKQKYADLQAVTEVVSSRLEIASSKVRALLDR